MQTKVLMDLKIPLQTLISHSQVSIFKTQSQFCQDNVYISCLRFSYLTIEVTFCGLLGVKPLSILMSPVLLGGHSKYRGQGNVVRLELLDYLMMISTF